ncbi:MAG: aldo/keto reductase [Candidatus Thermoplasmatota archaeon]|nr:aldo/keto reductase [Candidatus Thermoplasmatota archaeon]
MVRTLCGSSVSDFGIGTWGMGGRSSPEPGNDLVQVEAIKYALDKGTNVIDTAEMYASGHTEEIVSKAIKEYDRENLFIITKVWNTHLRSQDLLKAAYQSLKRLGTSYVDLYLIHWPNPSVPISESISAMEKLVKDGFVRNIGVSNFNVKELQDAMDATKKCEIRANQIEYNYGKREPEVDVIPFCEKNKVDVIAYTPIMKGHLTSYDVLRKIAQKYNATAIQTALNYVMRRSYPIPKSSSKSHIDELLGSLDFKLSDLDYNELKDNRY